MKARVAHVFFLGPEFQAACGRIEVTLCHTIQTHSGSQIHPDICYMSADSSELQPVGPDLAYYAQAWWKKPTAKFKFLTRAQCASTVTGLHQLVPSHWDCWVKIQIC